MDIASAQRLKNSPCGTIGVASADFRLDEFLPSFMAEVSELHMAKPNLFLTASEPECPEIIKRILDALVGGGFAPQCWRKRANTVDGISSAVEFSNSVVISGIGIDSGKVEAIRDILKEFFWPMRGPAALSIEDLFTGSIAREYNCWSLKERGLYVPYRSKSANGELRQTSFTHPPFPPGYHYILACRRIDQCPIALQRYLQSVFEDIPNHLFHAQDVVRASGAPLRCLGGRIRLVRHDFHDVIDFAKSAIGAELGTTPHSNLQKFMIANDPQSIACEIPVWIEPREIDRFAALFGGRGPLTGHIDLLRMEQAGRIGVWDYKPRAEFEQTAHLQVLPMPSRYRFAQAFH